MRALFFLATILFALALPYYSLPALGSTMPAAIRLFLGAFGALLAAGMWGLAGLREALGSADSEDYPRLTHYSRTSTDPPFTWRAERMVIPRRPRRRLRAERRRP